MDLFIQVKKAYDILIDSQKRAIYDVVGMKGLKAEGWEVNEKIFCRINISKLLFLGCKSNENRS